MLADHMPLHLLMTVLQDFPMHLTDLWLSSSTVKWASQLTMECHPRAESEVYMKLAKLESMAATGWIPSWRSLVYSSSETWRGAARALERQPLPYPMTSTSNAHSGGDLPLRMHPSCVFHRLSTGQENTILLSPSCSQPIASLPGPTLICNRLSLLKAENTSP